MPYLGLSRIGGVEWVNFERLATYAANGLIPGDLDLPSLADDTCQGLAALLYGDEPYRTPVQDKPPWYDVDDPDTFDFAGVYALELTGLDTTTRSVEVTALIGDGALAGRAIRGSRQIGGTAILLGRTTEGVQAGFQWFTRLLHGQCDDLDLTCTPGASLEFLTVCPDASPTADTDAAPLVQFIPTPADGGDPADLTPIGGTFTETVEVFTILEPYPVDDLIDGGDADEEPDTIDGGGAARVPDLIDAGDALGTVEASLVGPVQACTDGRIHITWYLGAELTTMVRLALIDTAGVLIEWGPAYYVDEENPYEWELPFGVGADWRPAIFVSDAVRVGSVEIETQPNVDPLTCVEPYWRQLPGTVCVSGPTPVETVDAGCAEMMTVEWLWSTSPWRYTTTTTLITRLSSDAEPTQQAAGVSHVRIHTSSSPVAEPSQSCPTPPALPANCAVDPFTAGLGSAPAVPRVPSLTQVTIAPTAPVRSYTILVGPEQVPGSDGVFTFELTAGVKPVVGARVRVWDDAAPDGTVLSPCGFAYEFLIDYVPAGGTLVLGGPDQLVDTLCDGATRYADAQGVVRGAYGGPVEQPVARCNRRYLIRVDQLDEYPRTAPGVYTAGQDQGLLFTTVRVTAREG